MYNRFLVRQMSGRWKSPHSWWKLSQYIFFGALIGNELKKNKNKETNDDVNDENVSNIYKFQKSIAIENEIEEAKLDKGEIIQPTASTNDIFKVHLYRILVRKSFLSYTNYNLPRKTTNQFKGYNFYYNEKSQNFVTIHLTNNKECNERCEDTHKCASEVIKEEVYDNNKRLVSILIQNEQRNIADFFTKNWFQINADSTFLSPTYVTKATDYDSKNLNNIQINNDHDKDIPTGKISITNSIDSMKDKQTSIEDILTDSLSNSLSEPTVTKITEDLVISQEEEEEKCNSNIIKPILLQNSQENGIIMQPETNVVKSYTDSELLWMDITSRLSNNNQKTVHSGYNGESIGSDTIDGCLKPCFKDSANVKLAESLNSQGFLERSWNLDDNGELSYTSLCIERVENNCSYLQPLVLKGHWIGLALKATKVDSSTNVDLHFYESRPLEDMSANKGLREFIFKVYEKFTHIDAGIKVNVHLNAKYIQEIKNNHYAQDCGYFVIQNLINFANKKDDSAEEFQQNIQKLLQNPAQENLKILGELGELRESNQNNLLEVDKNYVTSSIIHNKKEITPGSNNQEGGNTITVGNENNHNQEETNKQTITNQDNKDKEENKDKNQSVIKLIYTVTGVIEFGFTTYLLLESSFEQGKLDLKNAQKAMIAGIRIVPLLAPPSVMEQIWLAQIAADVANMGIHVYQGKRIIDELGNFIWTHGFGISLALGAVMLPGIGATICLSANYVYLNYKMLGGSFQSISRTFDVIDEISLIKDNRYQHLEKADAEHVTILLNHISKDGSIYDVYHRHTDESYIPYMDYVVDYTYKDIIGALSFDQIVNFSENHDTIFQSVISSQSPKAETINAISRRVSQLIRKGEIQKFQLFELFGNNHDSILTIVDQIATSNGSKEQQIKALLLGIDNLFILETLFLTTGKNGSFANIVREVFSNPEELSKMIDDVSGCWRLGKYWNVGVSYLGRNVSGYFNDYKVCAKHNLIASYLEQNKIGIPTLNELGFKLSFEDYVCAEIYNTTQNQLKLSCDIAVQVAENLLSKARALYKDGEYDISFDLAQQAVNAQNEVNKICQHASALYFQHQSSHFSDYVLPKQNNGIVYVSDIKNAFCNAIKGGLKFGIKDDIVECSEIFALIKNPYDISYTITDKWLKKKYVNNHTSLHYIFNSKDKSLISMFIKQLHYSLQSRKISETNFDDALNAKNDAMNTPFSSLLASATIEEKVGKLSAIIDAAAGNIQLLQILFQYGNSSMIKEIHMMLSEHDRAIFLKAMQDDILKHDQEYLFKIMGYKFKAMFWRPSKLEKLAILYSMPNIKDRIEYFIQSIDDKDIELQIARTKIKEKEYVVKIVNNDNKANIRDDEVLLDKSYFLNGDLKNICKSVSEIHDHHSQRALNITYTIYDYDTEINCSMSIDNPYFRGYEITS